MTAVALEKLILKLFGYYPLIFINDPASFDRWWWLRSVLRRGNIRTLDAGCGSGGFTIYAAKKGNSATGISFDERNNAVAKRRADSLNLDINFVTADLRALDTFGKNFGFFDQIICFETIEHILNDRKLIRDFHDLLNPGGRLLIATPYKHYRHFPGDYVSEVEDGGHVRWGYTFEEMRSLLVSAGFSVKKEEYVTGFISQYLCRLMKVFDHIFPHLGWLVTFPLRFFQIFDRPISSLLRYPYLSICVAAERV